MVPVDSRRVSRAPRYSGTCVRVRSAFAYMAITFFGRLFQVVRLAAGLITLWFYTDTRPTTPNSPLDSQTSDLKFQRKAGFGLVRVRSPLLAESLLFSIPVGTELVHFPTLSSTAYVFSGGSFGISQRGFPHSDIPGSKLICSSPGLIAAYRVLHRLLAPRHSPYTLSSLTIRNSN